MSADQAGTVLVTSRSFGSGEADPERMLREAGLHVVRGAPEHDLAGLRPVLAECRAWIAGTGPIGEQHLAAAPALEIVARYGTGTDSVDVGAAARRGVVVTNTPGANAGAVADHVLALLLAALRHVVDGDREVRAGRRPPLVAREIAALRVGLVGFGHVGRAVASRLTTLGTQVRACDPAVPEEVIAAAGVQRCGLDDMLSGCDAVSLHLPGGRLLVDAAVVDAMPDHAILVNTARADLVDETVLAAALGDGRLGAVAADVFSAHGPLLRAPRTVLTPHVAGQSVQAVDRMGVTAAEEVLGVLAGDPPQHRVG